MTLTPEALNRAVDAVMSAREMDARNAHIAKAGVQTDAYPAAVLAYAVTIVEGAHPVTAISAAISVGIQIGLALAGETLDTTDTDSAKLAAMPVSGRVN